MRFEMRELMPVVGKLARKYTACESTSITYERAEQLMEAVLYCIREWEQSGGNLEALAGQISAQRAYELGLTHVEQKVKRALALYHEFLPRFCDYGNRCLHDTVIRGLPEFFRRYDIWFEPQNTILTLDYPVLKDISGYTGIDKIYEFIVCIHREQDFLGRFPRAYVEKILSEYDRQYESMVENLCEIVLRAVAEDGGDGTARSAVLMGY